MSIKAYGQSSWRGRTVTVATMEEFLAENGYVIDFIDLQFVRFAVFNLADVAICLGAVIAAVSYILAERKNVASRTRG